MWCVCVCVGVVCGVCVGGLAIGNNDHVVKPVDFQLAEQV